MKKFIWNLLILVGSLYCYEANTEMSFYDNEKVFDIREPNPIDFSIDFPTIMEETMGESRKTQRVELLCQTLKFVESRGIHNVIGKSNEYGMYQYTPETWQKCCLFYFNIVLDITNPAHQDQLTKTRILSFIDRGYSDQQIASIWNCGSNKWDGKRGKNRFGVKYDVPKYVDNFEKKKERILKKDYYTKYYLL